MKKRFSFLLVCCVVLFLLLLECASQKAMWGNEKKGFILSYRLSPNDSWTFQATGDEKTSIDIMGSDRESSTLTKNSYTIRAFASDDSNLNTSVTIDNFVRESEAPEGESSIDASSIVGKNFGLILSPLGKEMEYKGIDDLKIDLGEQGGGVQSVLNFYRDLFPDLADKPIKVGDSWMVQNGFTAPAGNMDIEVNTETKHTLEGLESIGGMECLKFSTTFTGTVKGQGEQGGNNFDLAGDITGSGTWYFAYKKGAFVKSDGLSNVKGTIKLSGGYDLSMPLTQETVTSVQLVQN
ncbi:hypothetical protein JXA02_05770 [candidate division KSB1 bacterium]|nr:hypothetical protein [candidate division KSB1 bacterium]RQW07794.1 MAG: hypothetical protein EH222_06580 [candidate division KSB1 bacterium]